MQHDRKKKRERERASRSRHEWKISMANRRRRGGEITPATTIELRAKEARYRRGVQRFGTCKKEL